MKSKVVDMFCKKCGTELDSDNPFCHIYGNRQAMVDMKIINTNMEGTSPINDPQVDNILIVNRKKPSRKRFIWSIAGLIGILAIFTLFIVPFDRDPSDNKEQITKKSILFTEQIYGYSGANVPLMMYKIGNPSSDKKILCVFAIHGFEDAFFKDGQALVDIANDVIEHFKKDPTQLGSYELIIVHSANPDGIDLGWTCNGPGRCQISQGIDINMDFDYNFRTRVNLRNKTGDKPFSSPEAASLRDLIINEKPDIIIDFHGWVNSASGDRKIAEIFCKHLALTYEEKENTIYDGFFVGWAAKYAKAVLVEYPNPFTGTGSFDGKSDKKFDYNSDTFRNFGYAENTIKSIEEIVAKNI
jgi:hypothetical protein